MPDPTPTKPAPGTLITESEWPPKAEEAQERPQGPATPRPEQP